ncbi:MULTISPECIES: pyridoxamine 5'-phosphate oxidase [Prauserella salsuginis group]|uniref:Pyridoxine/pyridoxamine 5'-phosphate oxidase n=2 Tax=Prauserella salsuginis group TaxID=2893672 RepID=A0A839XSA6_9PSEU|nr:MULTISPECIES: pyridoxamine 5'-phosphate oxidase [Prauserella salsuginis group]MBB3663503.1 pyridoxamine 5'-phosphate oxidase [Prauserella sediminis]MCR3720677.1 Pyridoxamine 5'-phosphate oxidase [Prauserella flava]MCR3735242.1 Pyridoxamine 5'-phosphate oxidase [Prauserella salsuginis]
MAELDDVSGAAVRLPDMRVSYEAETLDEDSLAPTWHEQLQRWLDFAVDAGLVEPNAMVLATADADGMPSSRTVLCKGLDERGIVFYTNYTSAKSHDLTSTRFASVTFPWYALQRQVTVRGEVEKVGAEETTAYWRGRPRGSQLGAWASPQSTRVGGREALDDLLAAVERRFADVEEIPVPPHWGGWRVRPVSAEFWQGRKDRLHDRLRYVRTDDDWRVHRIAP